MTWKDWEDLASVFEAGADAMPDTGRSSEYRAHIAALRAQAKRAREIAAERRSG